MNALLPYNSRQATPAEISSNRSSHKALGTPLYDIDKIPLELCVTTGGLKGYGPPALQNNVTHELASKLCTPHLECGQS